MVRGDSRKFLQGKLFTTDGMVMHQLPHVHVLLMVPPDEAQPVQPAMDCPQIHLRLCLLRIHVTIIHFLVFSRSNSRAKR
jgi:hypothetical protein